MANKSEQAKELYVQDNLSVPEIAKKLGLSEATIYRYKNESKESEDWDTEREVFNMTPTQLVDLYSITLKKVLLEVNKDRSLLLQPGTADAITKSISNLKKLNPKSQMIGVIIDFIKVSDEYLGTQNPDLQKKLRNHWEAIKNLLVEKSQNQGIF